jgi:hypothetical protein
MKPTAAIEVCLTSHRRLLEGLTPLVDDDFLAPILLPKFSTLPSRADHAELLAWLLDRARAPDLAPW